MGGARRRFQFGGHPATLLDQLRASGAEVLLFSWPEPAGGGADETWFLPVFVGEACGALTNAQRSLLRKKGLNRTPGQLKLAFPGATAVRAAQRAQLKRALAALLPA